MAKNEDEYTPEQIVQELRATFREEAYELLADLENALLELEKDPGDKELIGRAFRAMHTIKGSGGACEFGDIVAFTHELETVFDQVRSGRIVASRALIDLILAARDHLRALFDQHYKNGSVDESAGAAIMDALREIVPEAKAPVAASRAPAPKPAAAAMVTYRIRFKPSIAVFENGTDPVRLLGELSGLGACRIAAQPGDIPALEDLDPKACHVSWDVILTTDRGRDAIEDVFIFVKDTSELKIDVIDKEEGIDHEPDYKKLGEILLDRGDVSNDELQKVLQSKKRVGEMLVENGAVAPEKVASALAEQQHVRTVRGQRQGAEATASIRVATDKLDSLVNLVGELVTVQARLSQTSLAMGHPDLLSISEEVERITGSLRDNTMNIRMVPIGSTFSKFRRVVRDLSAELGKEIELVTEGAETELDKTVIERLSDPLVHIMRNSIDHGMELPADRVAAGKQRTGTIHLSAKHSGTHVLIRVHDDGAGLDARAIRAKALEQGLIRADTELSEQQLGELILAPGFSTAKTVTGVSGRGVGMDVVKRAIDSLRGTIEISSTPGKGTEVSLKLPLTLAIIDGFLTRVGPEHYIFPLSLVEECIELARRNGESDRGRHLVNVRGQLVPYIRLREQFAAPDEAPEFEQIVITRVDGRRVGMVVDTVVGEHQTVIKSLGRFYREVSGISGATILGDGTVALVLDVPKLVRMVERQEAQAEAGTGLP